MHEKISSCIENVGRFKGSPLHSACGYGKIDAVRKLVEWDLSKTHLELTSAPADLPAFTNTSEPKDLEMPSKVNLTIACTLSWQLCTKLFTTIV